MKRLAKLVDAVVAMAQARDIPELERRRATAETAAEKIDSALAERMRNEMDLEKIEQLIGLALESIEGIEQGDADIAEAASLQWRAMSTLAEARARADVANVRAPGQLFVRRLVTEECERLADRCRRAVGVE